MLSHFGKTQRRLLFLTLPKLPKITIGRLSCFMLKLCVIDKTGLVTLVGFNNTADRLDLGERTNSCN